MGVIIAEEIGDSAGHDIVDGNNKLVVFEILSVLLQLLSIVFNGAIICTLCKRSLLKYPSNRFVFSLCLSHLIVSFLSVSISLVTTFLPFSQSLQPVFENSQHHEYPGSHSSQVGTTHNIPPVEETGKLSVPVQCTGIHSGVDLAHLIMMHINFGVAVCTSITVALISAERYITIARPMRYKSIVTARRSLYAIICCWLLAALITLMPLLLFENRNPVCGTFSVPMESLATYFGVVFAVVTVFALAVMIVCYTHIFRIAKAKCQKVQIGHFTASTVSSISSDWPSSVYSSAQGQHRFLHAGSRIESSHSLLHWVLLSNLGRHTQPLRVPNALRGGVPLTPPATPTLPPKTAFFSESALNSRRESDETTTTGTAGGSRNGSTSSTSSHGRNNPSNCFIDPSRSPLFQYNHLPPRKLKNRWKTYLQPNYNSPRKTIFTIMLLIGAVLFTQLPLSFVLFTSTVETTQRWFQFCISVLFSTSSVANPVLYGFLNRNIRDQLWRLLRRKSHIEHGLTASSVRKRKRQQQQLEEMTQTSKGFLSSANHRHLHNICRGGKTVPTMDIPAIKISRKESISSEDNSITHDATSSNSIDIIGRADASGNNDGAKVKTIQVQKRVVSSPYYRSVLLKKANDNSTKKSSLLPRLTLPDINVRRNSSGSIVSIRTNGIMSMMNEEAKDLDSEWSSSGNKGYEDNGPTSQRQTEVYVEMQTFRNYSTPDLQSAKSDRAEMSEEGKIYSDNDNINNVEKSENTFECQGQLSPDEDGEATCANNFEPAPAESSEPSENIHIVPDVPSSSSDPLDAQPGPSRAMFEEVENQDRNQENLEACLSVESLMGVLIDEELLPENFPRKPSQDSGADMAFSDDEEELPPAGPAVNGNHQPTAVIISAASLPSLPATLTVKLRTGGSVDDRGIDKKYAKSETSLVGPLLFIEHPETTRNRSSPQSILYLPCSCTNIKDTDISHSVENDNTLVAANDDQETSQKENGVTVTITDSNNDTQLQPYTPLRCLSNERLLQVENLHYHRQPSGSVRKYPLMAQKSKSESDICAVDNSVDSRRNPDSLEDLKIRSNCHIDCLVLGDRIYSNSSCNKNVSSANTTSSFTLLRSCNNRFNDDKDRRGDGDDSPCCSVCLSNRQLSRSVSRDTNCSEHNLNHLHLLPPSPSPQWLSVLSIHSSCSSLSSTCPLRIVEGINKSDVSDYDDFEDHIEI